MIRLASPEQTSFIEPSIPPVAAEIAGQDKRILLGPPLEPADMNLIPVQYGNAFFLNVIIVKKYKTLPASEYDINNIVSGYGLKDVNVLRCLDAQWNTH